MTPRETFRALAAAALMASASPAMAQTPMPVELRAVPGDASIGSTVDFELYLPDAPIAMVYLDVAVEYDPAILQPIDSPWSPGAIGWGPIWILVNGPDTQGYPNRTELAMQNMGSVSSYSGVYATLRFQVVGYGACALRLINDDGTEPDGLNASFYAMFLQSPDLEFIPLTVTQAAFDNSSLSPPPPLPSPSPDPGIDGGGGGGGGCRAGTEPGNLAPLVLVLAALTLYRTLTH